MLALLMVGLRIAPWFGLQKLLALLLPDDNSNTGLTVVVLDEGNDDPGSGLLVAARDFHCRDHLAFVLVDPVDGMVFLSCRSVLDSEM